MEGTHESPAPVAQPTLTLSSDEKIPVYYNDMQKIILLSNDENIKKTQRANEYALFSRFEKIASNKTSMKTYKFLLTRGASFAKEIAFNCEMSEASAYRAIDTLIEMDLIKPIAPVNLRKAAGPKPLIYGLHDATGEEEQKAAKRYIRSRTKAYKKVQTVKQLCLRDIIDESIQFSKIIYWSQQENGKNFHFMDIATIAAQELQDEGIKVWR